MTSHAETKTMSGIPDGLEKSIRKDLSVDLVDMIELLLKYLTPALCRSVFKKFRGNERERKTWSQEEIDQWPPADR